MSRAKDVMGDDDNGLRADDGCYFCKGDEFTINTREDVSALESSTCQGHRAALTEVLFDMAITIAARENVPGFTLYEDVRDAIDANDDGAAQGE